MTGRVVLTIEGDRARAVAALRALPGLRRIGGAGAELDLTVTDTRAALPPLLAAVVRSGAVLCSVEVTPACICTAEPVPAGR
ncbi:hypothetical protein DPM19_09435 [Actinomadura craniellae]|uniref:Lrp/AsnC family transcriptional regulator n=1 Tax=Actinomadura craniellae TaxID=2231787 RepID=A0A365H9Z5_9ACTN|nr:hypothetical protein [Actinomadura craniellae]RAY15960.1 hypothetical protein DPM19_09435 [Actinomadura craniellae]